MNPHSKTIARLYPKYAAMPLAQSLVLILLGMPLHEGATALSPTVAHAAIDDMGELTDTNLSADHTAITL